jgi:hypothetical protein
MRSRQRPVSGRAECCPSLGGDGLRQHNAAEVMFVRDARLSRPVVRTKGTLLVAMPCADQSEFPRELQPRGTASASIGLPQQRFAVKLVIHWPPYVTYLLYEARSLCKGRKRSITVVTQTILNLAQCVRALQIDPQYFCLDSKHDLNPPNLPVRA